ncbi:hypothetical protein SAMN05421788_107183 [Filimonas lacunae]|uniref:LTXXQ motif protein n=1 Tax=Filimonas lacunae TaxID=477680 RepID=A0A173MGA5_9BACT|nr:hypothetical protein [Filimonas lacunae]BAV06519.1 hypothetical protein FLA_2538 [Filimonas lacunae]SIT27244.1 hypothetical protein SAMN05421788_107183 [Filimonas lacunae]
MQKGNPFRVLLLAGALCFVSAGVNTVMAQKTPKKEHVDVTVKNITDSMKLKLALTDAQYPKVYKINGDFAAKLKAVKESSDDKDTKKEKAKAVNKEWAASLKTVLTAEQYKKFDEDKKDEKKQLKKAAKSSKSAS